MIHYYDNILNSPNLSTCDENGNVISGIHYDVANSSMTDKNLKYCNWDEETAILTCYFENTLSDSDKLILDSIIINNT